MERWEDTKQEKEICDYMAATYVSMHLMIITLRKDEVWQSERTERQKK